MLRLFTYCFFLLCVNMLSALYTDVSSDTATSVNQHHHQHHQHHLHHSHHRHNAHLSTDYLSDEHNRQKMKNSTTIPLRSYNRRHLHRLTKLPSANAAIATAPTTLTETSRSLSVSSVALADTSSKPLKLTLITHDHVPNGFTDGFNNNQNFNRWPITQNDMNWHSNIPYTPVTNGNNDNNNPSMGIVPTVITSPSTPSPTTTYRHRINTKHSGPG